MFWEVSGEKSRFKVDIRKDSMEKMELELGWEGNMGFRWDVRRAEIFPKPERNKNTPIRCREQRRMCDSRDGFQDWIPELGR